jgi:hypothetical protein
LIDYFNEKPSGGILNFEEKKDVIKEVEGMKE